MIDQEAEKLQRGWIDPVQVFHDKEYWLLGGDAQQDRQDGLQRLPLLLLGRPVQGHVVPGQRQGEQGGEEGDGLLQRQAVLHQEPLKFADLLARGLLAVESQRHPLQQIDDGKEGAVLVIRGTLARGQPSLGLGGHVLLQHLHEARFPDARLSADQHPVAEAVLHLCPALQQQSHLLLPAHQRG